MKIRMPAEMCDRKPLSDADRVAISKRITLRNLSPEWQIARGYLTEAQHGALRARIVAGELYKTIAADFDRSVPYVAELATNAGIARGRGRWRARP